MRMRWCGISGDVRLVSVLIGLCMTEHICAAQADSAPTSDDVVQTDFASDARTSLRHAFESSDHQAVPAWGTAGSEWWTFTVGTATDLEDALDFKFGAGYTTFVVKDIEFTAEAGVWYFDQLGDNAMGLSASMIFRWHFLNEHDWSLFADAGIGMMVATDNVPDGGTGFDVLPRFGLGATFQLDDAGTRLQLGVHWHHISNARIHGEDRNPSRDGIMFYTGVVVPF